MRKLPNNALERTVGHRGRAVLAGAESSSSQAAQPGSLDFTSMQRRTFIQPIVACLWIVVASVAVVVVLFYFISLTYEFEPSGLPKQMPIIGRAYAEAITFFYGPISDVVAKAYDRLPVRGWVISFASILTAVTIQNLLLWFGGKFALETWRARREI